MTNKRFYPAKERKNDFIVTVEYLQGVQTHTLKKSALKDLKLLGMEAWDIENPRYKKEEEYNKCVSKVKTDRMKVITISKAVFGN